MYFINKWRRVYTGRNGMKAISTIDVLLIKRDTLRYVHDVRVVKGMRGVISDHSVG